MKILLTLNKTYRGYLDGGYWHTYLPLKDLGHDVCLYDTVDPEEGNYTKIIESFKPDLIFCCMTGDKSISPNEPWEEIKKETESGRTKTFNWFCDDTWRFDNFSKIAASFFNVCSTPEPSYVDKYKEIGYNNILVGNWHINDQLYKTIPYDEKTKNLSFIGNLTPDRRDFLDYCANNNIEVERVFGVSHDELIQAHQQTRIGINLSRNDNDPQKKTQMKQRIFEIPAGKGLLMTEHHDTIEQFYNINEEIITFRTFMEFKEKINFLLSRPKLCKTIAKKGHQRYQKEHTSCVRLSSILRQIEEI